MKALPDPDHTHFQAMADSVARIALQHAKPSPKLRPGDRVWVYKLAQVKQAGETLWTVQAPHPTRFLAWMVTQRGTSNPMAIEWSPGHDGWIFSADPGL